MIRLSPTVFVGALLLVLLVPGRAPAQQARQADRSSELSVGKIMQEPETWVGAWPSDVRWHESGEWLSFDWNPKR